MGRSNNDRLWVEATASNPWDGGSVSVPTDLVVRNALEVSLAIPLPAALLYFSISSDPRPAERQKTSF